MTHVFREKDLYRCNALKIRGKGSIMVECPSLRLGVTQYDDTRGFGSSVPTRSLRYDDLFKVIVTSG